MDIDYLYDIERLKRAFPDQDLWDDLVAQGLIEGRRKRPEPRPIVEPQPYTVGIGRPICWQHDNPRLPIKDEFISSNPEFEWSLKGY